MTTPSPDTPKVEVAKTSDAERLIATIVLAFAADPIVRWAYPDPEQYLSAWPQFVKAFAGKAFDCSGAFFLQGYVGAALWLPPGVQPDEHAVMDVIARTAKERQQEEIGGVLEQMEGYHPREEHWYLPVIGIDPACQGKGLGSALLRHTLDLCDQERKVAYLESSKPSNVPFYERHGFKVLGTIQSGSSPVIWPMARSPQA